MELDEVDIKIINGIRENMKEGEEIRTGILSKKIFNSNNEYEGHKKKMLVIRRLHRLNGVLFKIYKSNGKWVYESLEDNFKFCKHKFPCGYKNSFQWFSDGKWTIQQI